jgi:thiamine-phosphate pyrophosphorylase
MSSDRRAILCLITGRRRLCASCSEDETRRCLLAQIVEAVAAGIDLVQIRERDMEAGPLAEIVSSAVAVSRGSATRIIVNDRLDIAIACRADGVHLRADSMPASAARRIAPSGFWIGRSVHDASEAVRAADGADYLIAGTVFETSSKPGVEHFLGEAGLATVVRAVSVPVLAIGGVTLDRLSSVAGSGAAGLAAIGLFIGGVRRSGCRAGPLRAIVDAARARFGGGMV